MNARHQLSQLLQTHHIHYKIPAEINGDDIRFNSIRAVCEQLILAQPSLLKPGYLNNLDALMNVAQDAPLLADIDNRQELSHRLITFQLAINRLASENPSALNQNTFNGIYQIITANRQQTDIEFVAQCFIQMNRKQLLSKKNIQDLVEKVINAPRRLKTNAQTLELSEPGHTDSLCSADRHEPGCAETLSQWLTACHWLRQADFTLMMRSTCREDDVFIYMQKLYEKRLNSPANCQALIDCGISVHSIRNGLSIGTQREFNESLFPICDLKLKNLKTKINLITIGAEESSKIQYTLSIRNQALAVFKNLCALRKSGETLSDPRTFLHTIAIIDKALPTESYHPPKLHIEELIAAGYTAKGHPSKLWRTMGSIMMSLGMAIAAISGITLLAGTLGITAPLGISIAIAGVTSALSGAGFFAYGSTRSGLSKSIMDLAESLQQPTIQLVAE
ncbi:hypothetical protein ELY21_12605 [Legionella sp. km535]|uniref:hypothetical protein n=1 Tax=Legionella sp. km535 TaxID=2498107 RepID=UPI000F8F2CAC|nr:hypothetical protein [Legionella sp. km535]RUR16665.1 hypothetical protein ELY21_12605 [Legionella sp. km535]